MITTTKLITVFLISVVILGFTNKPIGRITFILGGPGEVSISKEGYDIWSNAKLFSTVFNGDKIKTHQESRCEIKLNKSGLIRIGENTTFCLKQNSKKNQNESQLSFGKVWFNIKALFDKDYFAIKTPTAVCAIRGTIFRMDADSSTRIAVYDGAVDVGPLGSTPDQIEIQQQRSNSLQPYEVPGPHEIPPPFEVSLDQWVRIVEGYQIEIRNDGKYAKSKINETEDNKIDWIKWNQVRDRTIQFD